MAASLKKVGEVLQLTLTGLPKADFQDALQRVKMIPGRRWNPDVKVWELPADPKIAERVMFTIHPQPSAEVLAWVRQARHEQAEEIAAERPDDALESLCIPWAGKLYPFQRAGVEFLAAHPRAILGDDQGLGKTIEAMSAFVERQVAMGFDQMPGPRLVIAPNSVTGNWQKEIKTWLNQDAVIIDAKAKDKRERQTRLAQEAGAWIIVNWEQIRCEGTRRHPEPKVNPQLFRAQYACVFADEAHRAKNKDSQVTNGLWQLQAPVQYAMTGTAVLSNPADLWSLLSWNQPDVYNDNGSRQHPKTAYWSFFDQYVEYYESAGSAQGKGGRVITGVLNADALRFELQDKLIRRTKGKALGLPLKTRQFIDVELPTKQRALYDEAEKAFWLDVVRELGVEALEKTVYQLPNGAARCTRLQQILESPAVLEGDDVSGKLDACVELIQDAGRPVVVFTKYKLTCHLLADRLAKRRLTCGIINGDVDPEDRTSIVQAFQDGELDVVVGTIPAMGTGLTMTRADTAIFLSRDWTPGINDQAEDRLHRIGQTKPVTIIILQAPDTVDTTRVAPANELKSMIVSAVLATDHVATKQEAPA